MSALVDDPDFRGGLEAAELGELKDAQDAFLRAADRFPDSAELYLQLGLAYQRRAERILPPSMRAPNSDKLGTSLLGLGVLLASNAIGQTGWITEYREEFRRSVGALRKAIELDPDDPRAHHALALSLRYLGQHDTAADSAAQASALAPNEPAYAERAAELDAVAQRAAVNAEAREGHHGAMTWADVILPDKTKRELRQMQMLLENPSLSRDLGIDPPTGLLLHGAPGTGKTTIARVLAYESHCHFLATSPAQINSMWLGESEKAVKRLFDEARAKAPAIVFLDEIDALLPYRSGGINQYSDKVVNQFLHEMDGLQRNRRVFVVGATNRRDMLDPALVRGGRLSREIEIPLPDRASRIALFELALKSAKVADDIDLESLADRTQDWTGANIKAVVNEAGLQALLRLAETGQGVDPRRVLTPADFDIAIGNFTPPKEERTVTWPFPFGGSQA